MQTRASKKYGFRVFIEVPSDDGKPKYWNSSDKEMHIVFCSNISNELKQKLVPSTKENINLNHASNNSESLVLSKHLRVKNPAEHLDTGISRYLLKPQQIYGLKNCEETLDLLNYLNLALQLKHNAIPSHQMLSGKLLNNTTNKLQDKTLKTMKDAKAIILIFDGWKNIVKQNILGITCVTEMKKVIIYDARNISDKCGSTEATIKLIKDLLIEDKLKNINVIAIVTDSSSSYAAA
ncbi:33505_t:CDS:2, partial [Racocetra persica]